MYLEHFSLPSAEAEGAFLLELHRTCYTTAYPFGFLGKKGRTEWDFAPVTVLCGSNGCGKTTLLNVLAERLSLQRTAPFNKSSFFRNYTELCRWRAKTIPAGSRIITSDDVFESLLQVRCLNQGIDDRRDALLAEYTSERYAHKQLRSLEELEDFRRADDAKRLSGSEYVRRKLMGNVPESSNGESAFRTFTERIESDALYLLDEPENSLSPILQQQLADFLCDAVRFYSCQFILSTHSPFLMALPGALVYDLDACPVRTCRRTELPSVQLWNRFFQAHRRELDASSEG